MSLSVLIKVTVCLAILISDYKSASLQIKKMNLALHQQQHFKHFQTLEVLTSASAAVQLIFWETLHGVWLFFVLFAITNSSVAWAWHVLCHFVKPGCITQTCHRYRFVWFKRTVSKHVRRNLSQIALDALPAAKMWNICLIVIMTSWRWDAPAALNQAPAESQFGQIVGGSVAAWRRVYSRWEIFAIRATWETDGLLVEFTPRQGHPGSVRSSSGARVAALSLSFILFAWTDVYNFATVRDKKKLCHLKQNLQICLCLSGNFLAAFCWDSRDFLFYQNICEQTAEMSFSVIRCSKRRRTRTRESFENFSLDSIIGIEQKIVVWSTVFCDLSQIIFLIPFVN